ncbi:serine hydrolase domain-containing protein [Haliangium sp.]|uniref:serine hydrolase domain-containing protein n=1 Tax=Haliangium sp. TaxID=2663208 RepID=UPI003D1515FA
MNRVKLRSLWLHLAVASALAWAACAAPQTAPSSNSAQPAAAAASTTPAAAATKVPASFSEVHDYLDALVRERKIAGAAALVMHGGEQVYVDAVGMRDAEAGVAMTPDTIFRVCSMSKPIVSVGALMLVEEGRIALDDPVSKYIPAFADMRVLARSEDGTVEQVPAARPITIRDLFTHTSGITYRFLADDQLYPMYVAAEISDGLAEAPGTMADNVARLAKLPLAHQPGERYSYSLSIDVLGHVIEVVSGQTLAAFLEERIFAPLGMEDTGFRVSAEDEARLAAVYRPGADKLIERLPEGAVETGKAVHSASYPLDRDSGFYSGGAGLVSTVSDYARFAEMLLGGGERDGVRILSPETVAMMTSNQLGDLQVGFALAGDGYGLGIGVTTEAAPATVPELHLGAPGSYSWAGFYQTLFWVDPQNQLVGVVMTQIFPWDHLTLMPDFRARVYASLPE